MEPSPGADQPTAEAEVTAAQGLGVEHLAKADASHPAGQVVGDYVEQEPGGVGAELAARQVVEADPVLEVADGVLDLGVAAVVGLQRKRVTVLVGDEGVVGVEHAVEVELAARGGLDAADDEAVGGLAAEG